MPRFNIFNQIHKGLRAMLYNMALTIQHTDFSREEEAKATLRKMKQVLELYAEHGGHEDNIVFPAVREVSPATVASLEAEHEKDEQLTNDLLLQIHTYRYAANIIEKVAVGYSIHLAFQEFVAFNLQHMCREEQTINPLLWEKYSDLELMQLQKEVRMQVKPESEIIFTRWMLQGLSDGEIKMWFSKVQESAPAAVWNGLWLIAIDELGYERVSGLLSQEMMPSLN
ncbi:MAG: hemerythrin domain-containing protein [Chitinophagaceae bacterium]